MSDRYRLLSIGAQKQKSFCYRIFKVDTQGNQRKG